VIAIKNESWHDDAKNVVTGEYDLALVAAGWDSRCLSILESETFSSEHGIVIFYADKGKSGRSVSNETLLRDGMTRRCDLPPQIIEVDSSDALSTWRRVRREIVDIYKSANRPLRVLIDISTLPRYISMSLLGFGEKSGIFSEITIYYQAATEYSLGTSTDDLVFSAGELRPMPVIGLGTPGLARGASHLIVSVGFDGSKISRLVDSLEPDRLSLLFAEPGTSRTNERLAREQNRELINSYRVPASQIFSSAASSIQQTVSRLIEVTAEPFNRKDGRSEVRSILVCGTKTHAIAIAIYALSVPIKNVYYAQPKSHREVETGVPLGSLLTELVFPW
jgi:hypothetical protein